MTEIKALSDPMPLTPTTPLTLTPEEVKFMMAVRERRIKIEKDLSVSVLSEMYAINTAELLALRSIRQSKLLQKQSEHKKMLDKFKKIF